MAVQSNEYVVSASRTYLATKPIPAKDHMAVWVKIFDDGITPEVDQWIQLQQSEFSLINNSAVVKTSVVLTQYEKIEIRVADTPDELIDSPSDVAILAGIAQDIADVAFIAQDVVDINTEPMKQSILDAGTNAGIAEDSVLAAATSETNAAASALAAATSETNALSYSISASGSASSASGYATSASLSVISASGSATSAAASASAAAISAGSIDVNAIEALANKKASINMSTILDGSFSIVGTDLVASGVAGSISNGMNSTGSNNEVFTLSDGIITPTNGYADGDNYLKTSASGTVTSTLVKPVFGEVSIDNWGIVDGLFNVNAIHTTYTSITGTVSAISEEASHQSWKAFDNNNLLGIEWQKLTNYASGDWIKYDFTELRKVEKISLSWYYAGTKTLDIYYTLNGIDYVLDSTFSQVTTSLTVYEHTIMNNTLPILGLKYVFTSYAGSSVTTLTESKIYTKSEPTADYYLDGLLYDKDDVAYNPQQTYLSENGKLVKVTASGGVPSTITLEDDAPSIVEDCIQVDSLQAKGASVNEVQVVQPDSVNFTGATDTPLNGIVATIKPKRASNKVKIVFALGTVTNTSSSYGVYFSIYRNGVRLESAIGTGNGNRECTFAVRTSSSTDYNATSFTFTDKNPVDGANTYQLYGNVEAGIGQINDSSAGQKAKSIATITLTEIGA